MQLLSHKRALRVAEAAEALSVSRWTLYRAILAGQVRAIRLGKRSTRIPADEVERLAREGFEPGPGAEAV